MTFLADAVSLPDVNVWIAAASDRHEHHATARQWFDSTSAPICFCRVTQMAFLRLLTNRKVMGEDMLSPAEAIAVYRQLLADERVRFEPEPPNIENTWVSLMSISAASGSTWTDAYLAAFALEADSRLVSFESRDAPVAGAGVGTTDAPRSEPPGPLISGRTGRLRVADRSNPSAQIRGAMGCYRHESRGRPLTRAGILRRDCTR
jgi:uncharacterized protein